VRVIDEAVLLGWVVEHRAVIGAPNHGAEVRALAGIDPAAGSIVLSEALALWRGRAFEDFIYESWAQAEIARLEELRLEAVEARIEADLACGRSRELIPELESLVRQHPLREELTGQLMLALYRSGRQAEALRSYSTLRGRLVDELGVDPSAALGRLHDRMVAGDESLEAPRPAQVLAGVSPGLSVRGYELREEIGSGDFGIAYRAYQPAVGREVAIKVIRPELASDPSFIRRFAAEARLVAQLEHPHIVPLYDFWREPDAAYLVMRLMKGGTLSDRLEAGALTPDRAAAVVDQLAGALNAAHRTGLVHRDLKPSNILIDDDGNAYLSDFGIAIGDDPGPSGEALCSLSGDDRPGQPDQADRRTPCRHPTGSRGGRGRSRWVTIWSRPCNTTERASSLRDCVALCVADGRVPRLLGANKARTRLEQTRTNGSGRGQ
jgi:hypothetical protein